MVSLFLPLFQVIALCLCAVTATASMSSPNPQQQLLVTSSEAPSRNYQAPLRYCDGSLGEVIKGRYMVQLSPGYSFEEHCRSIRRDMNEYHAVILDHVFSDSVGYSCKGVADEVLDDIRANTSVKEVFCVPERGAEPEHLKKQ